MRTWPAAILLIIWYGAGGCAQAAITPPTGAEWQVHCKGYLKALAGDATADDFDVTYCIGMTQGMLNGLAIGSQLGALNMGSTLAVAFDIDPADVFHVFESKKVRDLLQVCEPEETGVSDYVRTIDTFLDAHPDKSGEPLAQVFFEAMQDAWPCSQ